MNSHGRSLETRVNGMNNNNDFEEIDLLDYLHVIVKRRRMIVRNTLVAAVLMGLISLFLPKYYTATTSILPPEDGDQSALQGLLANAPTSLLNLSGISASTSKIFQEILRSRTVAEGVLEKKYDFDGGKKSLIEIWNLPLKVDAIERLHDRTSITASEQDVIQIDVEMRDPLLAAQAAKAFVAELDRLNQEKSTSRAKSSRVYIEEQLAQTQANLNKASRALANFQAKYKAVDLKEQTKVAIEQAGEIKGTIMAKEVELQVARQTMKRGNPVTLRLQKQLDELKKQFEHLQYGNSVPYQEQRDYFIPFADVPEVGLRYANLMREVKVQETVWQLLNQQYYSAKIQEARDTPTVQVLDEAVPPERRSSPKRRLLVLVAGLLTFFASLFAAFVFEFAEKVKKNEGDFSKVRQITGELGQDYKSSRAWLRKRLGRSEKP